jgi:hypothetical protein
VAQRTCSYEGCERPHYAHGWCVRHAYRVKRWGDPTVVRKGGIPARDPLVRLLERIEVQADGCWINPYGAMESKGQRVWPHRLAYERMVGPIPDGYHVHHLCHVKACVNPDHLATLTPEQHNRIHHTGPSRCVRGHNDWRYRANGTRWCRRCNTDKARARKAGR